MEKRLSDIQGQLDDDFFENQPDRAGDPVFDVKASAKVNRHTERMGKEYHIHGVGTLNTVGVMDWIVNRTYEGESLVKISKVKGAPSLRQIMAWKRDFPSFAEELKTAEQARAYVMVEEAMDAAVTADKETAAAAKVHFHAATWNASKLDPSRYTERKIEEKTFSGLENQSTSDLLDRLRASIGANAEVIKLLSEREMKQIGMIIDIKPEPESSPPMSA